MKSKSPYDLLPIQRPLEDPNPKDSVFFYKNICLPLVKDILRIEYNGIPIDLTKVKELEDTVNNVLTEVNEEFKTNSLMQEYLKYKYKHLLKEKELELKFKTTEDFLKEFNSKDIVHRSYVINYYLKELHREDLIQERWTIKDLKLLSTILETNFLKDISNGLIKPYMKNTIDKAMYQLAEDKCTIYNTNKRSRLDTLPSIEFNPASSTQKTEFFSSLGIESESQTKGGKDQWNRVELQKLLYKINNLIEKE